MNPVATDIEFKQITQAAKESGQDGPHERLSLCFHAKQAGYLYIYLSNDNPQPVEVYFDDFKVTQTKSPVVQQDDYYPFGLTYNSYRRESSLRNNRLYNKGSELLEDLNLNFYYTKYRTYDQVLGRFQQVDPMVDEFYSWTPYNFGYNNPIRYNDPDGDCATCKQIWNSIKSWLNAPISKDAQAMGQGLMISSTGIDTKPTKRWQFIVALIGQAGSHYGGSMPGSLKIRTPKNVHAPETAASPASSISHSRLRRHHNRQLPIITATERRMVSLLVQLEVCQLRVCQQNKKCGMP